MRLAGAFALAIVLIAIAYQIGAPKCTADSPHGTAIGGVLRIEGCP